MNNIYGGILKICMIYYNNPTYFDLFFSGQLYFYVFNDHQDHPLLNHHFKKIMVAGDDNDNDDDEILFLFCLSINTFIP